MSRSRQELIDWVQSRIDEIGIADQPGTIDPSIISFEIDEAANNLLRSAERNIVYPLTSKQTPAFCLVRLLNNAPYSIIVPISSDVIRLLRTQMYEWNQTVDLFEAAGSDEYNKQINPFDRSTVNRPMAALVPFVFSYVENTVTKNFAQAVECFPPPAAITSELFRTTPALGNATENNIASAAVSEGLTVIFESGLGAGQHKEVRSLLMITRKTAESLPDDLHSPLVWMCASQLLTSMREYTAADQCLKHADMELKQLSAKMLGA